MRWDQPAGINRLLRRAPQQAKKRQLTFLRLHRALLKTLLPPEVDGAGAKEKLMKINPDLTQLKTPETHPTLTPQQAELRKMSDEELLRLAKQQGIVPDLDSILIPVNKFTGDKLTADEFLNMPKGEIEYIRPGRCYDLNRVEKSKESRKQHLLFYSGMTFLPPIIVLVLGIAVIWAFSGFVPKQDI